MAQDWFKGLRPAAAQSEGHRIGQTLLEGLNGQQGAIEPSRFTLAMNNS